MERIPKVAYLYEENEAGHRVRGTTLRSKEKPKVSQRDRDEPRDGKLERRLSRRDQSFATDEEEDIRTAQLQAKQKQQQREREHEIYMMQQADAKLVRRNSIAGNPRPPHRSEKQPMAHQSRNNPHLPHIDTSYQHSYNMPAPSPMRPGPSPLPQQSIPIRPRPLSTQTLPTRSSGYMHTPGPSYGPGPPISASAFFAPPPQSSFPPPSPSAYLRFNMTPTGGNGEYFPPNFTPQATSRPLSSRFDLVPRTQSAFGGGPFVPPPQSTFDQVPRTTSAFGHYEPQSRALVANSYQGGFYDDIYAPNGMAGVRQEPRDSIRTQAFTQQELDYEGMPPPPRPNIVRRSATDYPATHEYTAHPEVARHERQHSRDSHDSRDYSPRPQRQNSHRHSASYDQGPKRVIVEPANNGRRRQSYYEPASSSSAGASSSYRDKMNDAQSYQEVVSGPTIKLTAKSLKEQKRQQAGSKSSTKSSVSRDESDVRKSVTTRTTRSGSNEDENTTIKLIGKGRVTVGKDGKMIIDSTDGVEITQNKFNDDRTQRSSSDFEPPPPPQYDDPRGRPARPAASRPRTNSISGQQYSRSRQQHHNDYDY